MLLALALFVLPVRIETFFSIAAVITGMVSAGLLTVITLNYTWGAVGSARAAAWCSKSTRSNR